MCYLCEAKGITGPQYRETQKAINAAITTWRRMSGGGHKLNPDWTKLPPKRMWKAVTP